MKIKPPSLDSMWSKKADPVPDGWFTRAQLEKEWNLSQSQTAFLVRRSVEEGRAELKKFPVLTPSRVLFPTPHYKFK